MSTATASLASAASSRADELARAARRAAGVLVVLLADIAIAAAIVRGHVVVVGGLVAAVVGFTLVFQRPIVVALAVVALTDFLFRPTFFPQLPAGPTNLRLHELALAGLLFAAAVRPRVRTWGDRAGTALALFLVVVAVSGAAAVASGRASASDAIAWSRPFFMLTVFWVVVRLLPEPAARRGLLLGGAILAAVGGIVALALALGSGLANTLLTPADLATAAQHGVANIKRIRLPGLSIGYALFWYVAVQVYLTRGVRRAGWALLMAGNVLAIAISFNRNMWLGLTVGLVLMAMVGGFALRARLMHALAVGLAGVVVIGIVGAGSARSGPVAALIERGQTIFQPAEVTQESSLRDREQETSLAWKAFTSHPVLGVGPGAPFGVWKETRLGPHSTTLEPQLFLHNQYLYLLLLGGVPALAAFVLFLLSSIRRAWSREPPDPLVAACGVGLAMIMASSIVAIYFSVEDMTIPLGLLAGIIAADRSELDQTAFRPPVR